MPGWHLIPIQEKPVDFVSVEFFLTNPRDLLRMCETEYRAKNKCIQAQTSSSSEACFSCSFYLEKGVLVFYIHCNVCKTCRLFRNLKLAENVKRKLSSMIKIYCYLKICVIPSATVGERLHIVYYSHNIFHIYFLDTAVINFYFRLFLTILKHHTGKTDWHIKLSMK